jgi:hypothetical protein
VISELDETIRQILVREGGLDSSAIDVSFEIPTREWSAGIAKPTINCYLFDIRQNSEYAPPPTSERRSPGGQVLNRRPPLRVDLTYIVTAWTRQVEDEHRLLWYVLTTLMRFPVLPTDQLQGALREHSSQITTNIVRSDGVLKSPGEFWTALSNTIKPSLTFGVTLAAEYDSIPAGPPVLSRQLETTRPAPEREAAGLGLAPPRSNVLVGTAVAVGARLSTSSGAPLAGAEVRIEGRAATLTTDAEGRFVIDRARDGVYTLMITPAGGTAQPASISVPSGSYDIVVDQR